MKKTLVLVVLFILPIIAYLFFASGVNNFGRLPILTENVPDIENFNGSETFQDKITILGFMGSKVEEKKGNAFNLNQKIYKRFFEFHDFQIVMVLQEGSEGQVMELKKGLGQLVDLKNWKFVYGNKSQIQQLFNGLHTNTKLDSDLSTPYVFIIDKDKNLRGRKKDEDGGTKFGFNTTSVADLNNKMEDDVKIILAEYRLALKSNNAKRDK